MTVTTLFLSKQSSLPSIGSVFHRKHPQWGGAGSTSLSLWCWKNSGWQQGLAAGHQLAGNVLLSGAEISLVEASLEQRLLLSRFRWVPSSIKTFFSCPRYLLALDHSQGIEQLWQPGCHFSFSCSHFYTALTISCLTPSSTVVALLFSSSSSSEILGWGTFYTRLLALNYYIQ